MFSCGHCGDSPCTCPAYAPWMALARVNRVKEMTVEQWSASVAIPADALEEGEEDVWRQTTREMGKACAKHADKELAEAIATPDS